jgi:hypothetical protein
MTLCHGDISSGLGDEDIRKGIYKACPSAGKSTHEESMKSTDDKMEEIL